MVTDRLAKAIEKIGKLPDELQDEIAEQILDDLENERAWKRTLVKPQSKLRKLAEQALQESREGTTKKMGFDGL